MRIAVALARNTDGQVLLVRKRGTMAFMQPGGKIESGEDARMALSRELAEELALTVPAEQFHYLGSASAPAANEPGVTVEAEIYSLTLDRDVFVQAEIEEMAWVDPANPLAMPLAPLTRDHVLPMAVASL
ncbi:MAG: NUDIX domain-containing protein [Zavarzinia sp.]|nr:NUDIX domain-containing protein [Zavarzinia sp.]